MQYLIDHSQNEKLRSVFHGIVPPLAQDEVLLEAAFSLPKFRGRGSALHAIPRLAMKAQELGARWLVVYVGVENTPMLKACRSLGFVPFTRRESSYRLFRLSLTFTPLPEGTAYPFETKAAVETPS